MGGQATPGTQLQSTSNQSRSEPHPYVQEDLLRQLAGLRRWEDLNPNAPLAQIAGASPAQQSARDATWGWATGGLNTLADKFSPAVDYLGDAASGKYLDAGNPYMARSLEAMFRPQNEQFADRVLPSLEATFGSAGRPGGGLQWESLRDKFQSDVARAQADASAKAASDIYGMERGLQSSAASMLPGALGQMSNQAGGWLDMLQRIGASDTANNQARLDAGRSNFYAQPDYLTGMAQRYLGMFPGGQTLGSGTTMGWNTGGGGGGGLGSILGPLASIVGTGIESLPYLGIASDRRMKTDIEKLGVDPLTGLPMYAYRYKDDPKTYPKVVGPMAQDVEARGGPTREIGGRHVIMGRAATPRGLM
ncbi:MAG: tail fiber domain-containing protein [Reyranella sp.]|nr:tail fiber domain-containing protein [Reyranella sp.]